MSDEVTNSALLELTSNIVSAHVANNSVAVGDVPKLVRDVYETLSSVSDAVEPEPERPEPAVSIKASVKPDYLVCLEDGKKLKMLKRHLWTHYGLTPDAYRERWGLPHDYPMVAESYAKRRSELARKIGLGRRKATEEA